jgi:hypothetical protein
MVAGGRPFFFEVSLFLHIHPKYLPKTFSSTE